MMEMKEVELAETERAVPIIFWPKKLGSFRIFADYRKQNVMTERYFYPINRTDE